MAPPELIVCPKVPWPELAPAPGASKVVNVRCASASAERTEQRKTPAATCNIRITARQYSCTYAPGGSPISAVSYRAMIAPKSSGAFAADFLPVSPVLRDVHGRPAERIAWRAPSCSDASHTKAGIAAVRFLRLCFPRNCGNTDTRITGALRCRASQSGYSITARQGGSRANASPLPDGRGSVTDVVTSPGLLL